MSLFNKTPAPSRQKKRPLPNDAFWQDFTPYYKQHLEPLIDSLEQKRLKALQTSSRRALYLFPLIILGIVATAYFDRPFFFLVLFIGFIWLLVPLALYNITIKRTVFPIILRYFGPDYVYKEKTLNNRPFLEKLKTWGLFPFHANASINDYMKGRFKDVVFETAEVSFTTPLKNEDEDSRNHLVLMIDMNKNFSGKTLVFTDTGFVGNLFKSQSVSLQKVRLEDPVFEDHFEVYSDDQTQARYLLTSAFMDRLLDLRSVYQAGHLMCGFYLDKAVFILPLALYTKRFTSSSIFKRVDFIDDINTIFKEMDEIFKIISFLRLDVKTGV